jgi:hypothetical protein
VDEFLAGLPVIAQPPGLRQRRVRGPTEPLRFTLQPREKLATESVQLSPRGGNCTVPLAPDRYEIAPVAPEHDLSVALPRWHGTCNVDRYGESACSESNYGN